VRVEQHYPFNTTPTEPSPRNDWLETPDSGQHDDAWPFVTALMDAFTLDHCLWASDWPFLRSPLHVDYGVLLRLVLSLFPDSADRRKLLWETPGELFGFAPDAR
jgi:predicted TIM-barrel fold metal-dependent hydrolase